MNNPPWQNKSDEFMKPEQNKRMFLVNITKVIGYIKKFFKKGDEHAANNDRCR